MENFILNLQNKQEKSMDKKLSVVVPVYNVEQYLNKCLDSIVSQTYKNLEIILVNDCSTDNSYEICLDYAQKDERMIIINKQKNEGLGCARITGINTASGEYIGWVDSDDWIAADMFTELIQIALKHNADIVQCKRFLVHTDKILQTYDTGEIKLFDGVSATRAFLSRKSIDASYCNKIFTRRLFDEVSVSPSRISEDEDSIYKLLFNSGKVAFYDKSFYYNLLRSDSLAGETLSVEKALKQISISSNRLSHFETNCPVLVPYCKKRHLDCVIKQFFLIDRRQNGSKSVLVDLSARIPDLYKNIKHSLSSKARITYIILIFASRRNVFACIMRLIITWIFKRYKRKYKLIINKKWIAVKA